MVAGSEVVAMGEADWAAAAVVVEGSGVAGSEVVAAVEV